ncbi:hypothetical protein LEP1GSC050_3275 [Leptospira broomii serovar Hurstbridge str. 5399]|uniref:Uncharacterized protein n=1 Tax=Leptospira broomii serovar Hurstbridge str. 5399 TaxID=1049789 RepID=T0F9D2_9LEPT|nr:hypothetical protein LEP1GSC050_3275 [Leptospira broomii serovar Hurstbridge str. 5399]
MKYSTSFGLYSDEPGNFFPKNLRLYLRRKSSKIRDEFRDSIRSIRILVVRR